MNTAPQHGGPDALGAPAHDFSTNAHAGGPCPAALYAVQAADAQRYPDPTYTALRASLAAFHAVDAARIVLAASASEFIARITAWVAREGGTRVWLPVHAYGDYARSAAAWRLSRVADAAPADLAWLCEPASPLGVAEAQAPAVAASPAVAVLDRAYEPLRLSGQCSLDIAALQRVWQLWSPNKALGLTGVRAAYAIAPLGARADLAGLEALAASWPIGAHGESMLMAWTRNEVQAWVADSRNTMAAWARALRAMLERHGWVCAPSDTAYLCARPPQPLDADAFRLLGIKLRDATSFGLPGWWRLSAQRPEALAALDAALQEQLVNEGTPR